MKKTVNIKTGCCLVICLFVAYGVSAKKMHNQVEKAAAKEVIVGDQQHPEKLSQEIQDAYANEASKIIIRPGTYNLVDPVNEKNIFLLKDWKDITISAYGVTLILANVSDNHHAFHLENCNNVTIEGATVSQTKEPAYQGAITAVGKDGNGNVTIDWTPDAGYPVMKPDVTKFPSAFNVADIKTRRLKTGIPDYYGSEMVTIGGGAFRITVKKPSINFGVGDWIVGRNGSSPCKFYLANSTNCTIKDVTMKRNGFSTIREDGGGSNHILHCTWALGPRPDGATVDPLVSCTADGFHSTFTSVGPDMEDCEFQGILLDDPIAIHGFFTLVIAGNGNTMVCHKKSKARMAIGHQVRITNDKGFIKNANIVNIEDNGDTTITIVLDKVLNVPAGAKFSDVAQDGQGAKILRCKIGNTRSRGILLKGDNGLIKDNVFDYCGMSAVSLGPEFFWNESNYVENITITGNTFMHNGNSGNGKGVILVHGEGALGNKNIIIKNNKMMENFIADMYIEWADGVTIADNDITGLTGMPSILPQTTVLVLKNSRNISFSNNKVHNAAFYKPDLIVIGDNVSGVGNNDKTGIKIVTGR